MTIAQEVVNRYIDEDLNIIFRLVRDALKLKIKEMGKSLNISKYTMERLVSFQSIPTEYHVVRFCVVYKLNRQATIELLHKAYKARDIKDAKTLATNLAKSQEDLTRIFNGNREEFYVDCSHKKPKIPMTEQLRLSKIRYEELLNKKPVQVMKVKYNKTRINLNHKNKNTIDVNIGDRYKICERNGSYTNAGEWLNKGVGEVFFKNDRIIGFIVRGNRECFINNSDTLKLDRVE